MITFAVSLSNFFSFGVRLDKAGVKVFEQLKDQTLVEVGKREANLKDSDLKSLIDG